MSCNNHSSTTDLSTRKEKNYSSLRVNISPLYFAGLLVFGCVSVANAAIVADAGQASRPAVNAGANGSTVVNINAAGKGGVSHNIFNQFNVDKNGVVLNNSVDGANSQLAGSLAGNANLSGGAASVILNEVNSNQASVLNGMVEVAGQQAQVIIANPAGITCSGCGFINTGRATLTTGTAQFADGAIQGYKTENGTIVINGDGLKSGDSNYTDLIARSVVINAGVWAKDLKVTTGRNSVNADNTQATALASASGRPRVGIDVAALGGMYADKITLVGTESGVGVRNAGTIAASTSDLVMDVNGVLDNRSGSITAARANKLNTAGAIDNTSGLIRGGSGGVTINTNKNRLTNINGNIAASGSVNINSGQLNNTNGLVQTSSQVTIDTNGQLLTNTGRHSGAGIYSSLGMTLKTGQLNNNGGVLTTAGKSSITSGTLDNRDGQIYAFGLPFADLDMSVAGNFDNRNGEIAAQRKINLATTGTVNNTRNGKMSAGNTFTLTTNRSALNNSNGLIESAGSLNINSGALTNSNGTLQAAKTLSVDTNGRNLLNESGAISSKGDINLTNIDAMNNQDGRIGGNGKLSLQSNSLDNRMGGFTMVRGNEIRVSNTLNNNHGVIGSSMGSTAVYASTINNDAGVLGGLNVYAETTTLRNDAGLIYAQRSVDVQAATIYNRDSKDFGREMGVHVDLPEDSEGGIVSKGDLNISGDRLYNRRGLIVSTNGNVNMKHRNVDNSRGTVSGVASLSLVANNLDNGNGTISSKGISRVEVTSAFTNSGSIRGNEGLDVNVHGALTNRGQLLSDKVTTINSQGFTNRRGAVTTGQEGVKLNLAGGRYTNSGTVNGPVTKE
ncbi:two-partner secretion domain-containing protein [Serratia silvae]|uniref:Filamentous hemagglutinin N-terminal domain-containing protein n=1 Tax=Serratia silvae TaxID=2824122 RepID=A0ABT0KFZ4_9GAMM|nr:filamentous hemagglutinin N-terminal domain-containing protein [Serratia silvae]MCL1030827.1 filamentous hemagglutinin N-terminal domain-containing protein [Serratia silvae]